MRRFFQKVIRADSLLILKRTKPSEKDLNEKKEKEKEKEKSKTKEKKSKDKSKSKSSENVSEKQIEKINSPLTSPSNSYSSLNKNQLQCQTYKLKEPLAWNVEDVIEWLRDIGLGEYENVFQSNSIRGIDLPELEDEDLISISMNKIGHRKKLLSRIAQLFQGTTLDGVRSPNMISNNSFSSAVNLPTTSAGSEILPTTNHPNSVFSEPHLLQDMSNIRVDCVYLQDKPIVLENLKAGATSFQLQLRLGELSVGTLLTRISQKLNIEKEMNEKKHRGWELKFMDVDGDLVTVQFDHHLTLATRRTEGPIKLFISCRDLPPGLDISASDSSSSSGTSASEDDEDEDDNSEETSE